VATIFKLHREARTIHADELLRVIGTLQAAATPEQFVEWTRSSLQSVLPHGSFLGGVGRVEGGQARIDKLLSHNFPQPHLQQIATADGTLASPILKRWLTTREPQLFEPEPAPSIDAAWLRSFQRSALHNLAAHGQLDSNLRSGSYFVFARIPSYLTEYHAALLRLLVPHMHTALLRVEAVMPAWRTCAEQAPQLTPREQQVLQLLSDNKSNGDIASLLGSSAHTVKHQVGSVVKKLNATDRYHAVGRGVKLGLLPERRG
jgi:transcriptional regulator EpsA